jgi:hypothetical protein
MAVRRKFILVGLLSDDGGQCVNYSLQSKQMGFCSRTMDESRIIQRSRRSFTVVTRPYYAQNTSRHYCLSKKRCHLILPYLLSRG